MFDSMKEKMGNLSSTSTLKKVAIGLGVATGISILMDIANPFNSLDAELDTINQELKDEEEDC